MYAHKDDVNNFTRRFDRDNDATCGSKGDYIFKEKDEAGTNIVSIMFERGPPSIGPDVWQGQVKLNSARRRRL